AVAAPLEIRLPRARSAADAVGGGGLIVRRRQHAIRALKGHEIAIGFFCGIAFCAPLFVLDSDTSAYHQICETNQPTRTPHHIPYVVIWLTGEFLNYIAPALTAFATLSHKHDAALRIERDPDLIAALRGTGR